MPLGPDKGASYPPTQAGFRQARQYILSVLNYDKTVYKDALGNVICDGTTITGSDVGTLTVFAGNTLVVAPGGNGLGATFDGVVVTDSGAEYLIPPQEELILIPARYP